MKKIIFLIVFLTLESYGQTITRSFPIPPFSIGYSMGSSARIVPTPDNGFLLNYSYSYPNWDAAPGYSSIVIKTDANFIPSWSRKLVSGNGKKTIILNDGSSLFFSDSGSLLKLDANGQTVFSIGNLATYPQQLNISDAELIGTTIKAVGSKDTYNGFGYITSSTPVIIDFDTDGNVLQTYTLTGSTFTRPTNISKDTDGNYYLSGYSYTDGNYICKINSANTVLWCKRFKYTNNSSIITINDVITLTNGDVLLAGGFYNYSLSLGSIFIYRLSSSGNQISAKTSSIYACSISNISELSTGELVATGWLRENDLSFNRTFSMKMNSNEVFSWLKIYNEGFGISAPYIKSENDWYYTAFHFNNQDNNNPIVFNTENNGTTSCPYNDITLNFENVPLFFNAINLTLTPNSSLLGSASTVNPYPTETQTYDDACIPTLALNEINDETNLVVYPNPSKGEVHLVSKELITSVQITNTLGQIVKTYHPNHLEATFFIEDNGVYLIKTETERGTKNTKIIISN
jgi:Secretion system C-terminal sorting domain